MKNFGEMKVVMVVIRVLILLTTVFFLQQNALAHVEHQKDEPKIGLQEKLGQYVPLELTFNDEEGHPVTLRQIIHTPTILALVYYHCPNVCSLLLQNLADVLNSLPAEPEKEFAAVAISFDERETPAYALQRKKVFLQMIRKPFPGNAWRFLTGDKENILKLTEAVGFHFRRAGEDFEHPVALIILTPDGKIVRYMYGAAPLPFDLKLALVEASQGKIGPTISQITRFCFRYDPEGKKLVFNTLKVTGTVTLLFALSFAAFLFFKGKKRNTREEPEK
jgi:protein SCO1